MRIRFATGMVVNQDLARTVRDQVYSLRSTSGAETGEHRGKESFSFGRIHDLGLLLELKVSTFGRFLPRSDISRLQRVLSTTSITSFS